MKEKVRTENFESSIWHNLEDILSILVSLSDNTIVQEECGSELNVIALAIQQVQNRLEIRDSVLRNK